MGEKAELMLRISFDAIYISQSVFSNDSFFLLFYQEAGVRAKKTHAVYVLDSQGNFLLADAHS